MKIAVNTRLLIKNKLEGIGWFTYESLKRIVHKHPEHDFYFIFDRAFDPSFIFEKNVHPIIVGPPARHPILFYIWFEWSIPRILKKIKADLFISPDAFCSLRNPGKSLLVIHDLNFEHYPENLPWLVRKYYRYFTPKFARKADRIATVSEFSKQDIVNQYNINPSLIDVVYNGANERFTPIDETVKQETRSRYSHNNAYFLFIGALNPRKNLVNLFKAFDLFKTSDKQHTQLLIVGEKMWWSGPIKDTYEQMIYKDDVLFTGRLEPDELHKVMGAALALTYVSYFEGFGIPIIEAFNSEIPVITANVSSMPEIAADAAILVDPYSPESIAGAMHEMACNPEKRTALINKGKKRRKDFSWEQTADYLWQSIEKTLNTAYK